MSHYPQKNHPELSWAESCQAWNASLRKSWDFEFDESQADLITAFTWHANGVSTRRATCCQKKCFKWGLGGLLGWARFAGIDMGTGRFDTMIHLVWAFHSGRSCPPVDCKVCLRGDLCSIRSWHLAMDQRRSSVKATSGVLVLSFQQNIRREGYVNRRAFRSCDSQREESPRIA